MHIYYKTTSFTKLQCQHVIEIGPFDKEISDEYNTIYWQYVKNNVVPGKLDEYGNNELPSYAKLHYTSKILVDEIYQIEEWNMRMVREINEGERKKKSGRPSLTQLPIQYETIADMVASPMYDDIVEINFMSNNLTELPRLPKNLKILSCLRNKLSSLPKLPDTLIELDISFNEFKTLNNIPPNLVMLSCSDNQLEFIGKLPNTMKQLFCYNNKLRALPELNAAGECKHGTCHGNYEPSENKIPCLHNKLVDVFAQDNPIVSIPKSYFTCMKCYGTEFNMCDYKLDTIVCKGCRKQLRIILKNTPLEKSGGLERLISGDMPVSMDIEKPAHSGSGSDEDDDMVISYDKIN